LAFSGLYLGNQWASKRGWRRVFSIFIAMPVGGLITLIGTSLYFAVLEKVFNPDKKQAPTSFTPSFDCTKASNGAERLICNDRELSRLDVELNVIYQRYYQNIDAKDKKSLKANQVEWMTLKRNACSDVPCMVEAYKERINEMNSFN
jgi:uncharacterized protein YecT (DUF1311 family)